LRVHVELKDVYKIFEDRTRGGKVKAVDGVSFEVYEGELVTLLGPSGCGKTTTLRLIGGFEIPTSGDIFIDGSKVNDLPPNKRPTSMVFQSYALFPHMTVFENVAYGLRIKKLPTSEIKKKVLDILNLVGLKGLEKRYPGKLSGGQQQRVALARALVVEPKVLLLDEPLSNLDAKLREQMRVELKRIQRELKITSIYVTHDQLEAMTLSDRIIVMNNGKIVQIADPEKLYRFPQNRFVANFVGRANFMKVRIVRVKEGGVIVKLPNGKEISVDNPYDIWEEDEEVDLLIRPEGIEFVSMNSADLVGDVVNVIYTRNLATFEIKLNGQKLNVDVMNPDMGKLPSMGEKVGVKIDRKSSTVVKDI